GSQRPEPVGLSFCHAGSRRKLLPCPAYRLCRLNSRFNWGSDNMNILRKTALALVNQAKYGRLSKKKMMFKAALNPQVLLDIIFPKK
ncbi:MAG TPA: hypothetical protein H9681_01260, partial [Firmicutes bacterium]|nr:hypothetical protein [Bacillota bacterium]